jgi:hypothetical protein
MAAPIVYWSAVSEACSVLIAANDLLLALKPRAAIADGELLTFTDTEALRALEAIGTRRPRLVALERQFAATPRGAALINRIKADRALDQTEIRVLSHDSDFSRVVPRTPAAAAPAKPAASSPASAAASARTEPATTATMEPQALDESGTRRAPRFKMTDNVEVLIDGNTATLVEMSICGAHVVSPTILKPNQRVRLVLTDEAGMVRVNASIAWASFEIPPSTGPRYRAGLDFVDGDVALLGAFCHRHKA